MNCKFQFLYFVTREKAQYIEFHRHSCFEFVYYIKGSGSTTIADTPLKYSNNTFSIISPNTCHDEKHFANTDIIFIGFDYSDPLFPLVSGIYNDSINFKILNILNEMKNELLHKNSFYEIKLDILTAELLLEFGRIIENPNPSISKLTYVYKFIDENYNQKIDLQVLAELSGYSYHRFRHIFKEQKGLSPINYIIKKRVDNAVGLLTSTSLSISRIASECGFSSTSQFCSQFRAVIRHSPVEYRQQKGT